MKDKIVAFPKSSENTSISTELKVLEAQDLMIHALFGEIIENPRIANENDSLNVDYTIRDLALNTH